MATSKKKVKYIIINLTEHATDVSGLTLEERGTYEALRLAYIERGGPLPNDLGQLYGFVGASGPRERDAVSRVLAKKFSRTPAGEWRSAVCDAELARITKRSDSARKSVSTRYVRRSEGADLATNVETPGPGDTYICSTTTLVKNNNKGSSLQEEPNVVVVDVPAPPKDKGGNVGAEVVALEVDVDLAPERCSVAEGSPPRVAPAPLSSSSSWVKDVPLEVAQGRWDELNKDLSFNPNHLTREQWEAFCELFRAQILADGGEPPEPLTYEERVAAEHPEERR